MKLKFVSLAIFMAFQTLTFAQDKADLPKNWQHLDFGTDNYRGVSAKKMYEALGNSKPAPVVVAVIDSGVDAEHEDLAAEMWVNTDEIPGNGIDDDKNGYVDDIHGWNFIGGKDGQNVGADQLEITRLYVKYKNQFGDKTESEISKKDKKAFKEYKRIDKIIEEKVNTAQTNLFTYSSILEAIDEIQKQMGKEDFSAEELEAFETEDEKLQSSKAIIANIMSRGADIPTVEKELGGAVDYFKLQSEYHYNTKNDPRSIVGDNYSDSYEKGYGNNDVEGPDAGHGTHVAGIIGATIGNGIGMEGISNSAEIMSIRAVPDGDERDKDVANAIIYAVDNGASVVNMSFGKGYSWDKRAVDKAVKYARKKDVLLVHAAGNSNQNNDKSNNFPNDKFEKKGLFGPKYADNWLEVGALSWKKGADAPATFSNYGKTKVDLFAPGVDILSTTPDDNYERYSGTSMAAPVVAGVATVLRAYFPDLSAKQVKQIIMDSTTPITEKVKTPGSGEIVNMKDLAVTGGVLNAAKAVELAKNTKGKAKKKRRNFKLTPGGKGTAKGISTPTP